MNNKLNIPIIAAIVVLMTGALSYVYTAPYPGNEGLSRTPGVRIGGADTAPPRDFSSLNDVAGNLIMKLSGFPPFVVYLSFVGTPEGVITATRPDGGYWAQRVREGRNEGWCASVMRRMRCKPPRSWVTREFRCSSCGRAGPACPWT